MDDYSGVIAGLRRQCMRARVRKRSRSLLMEPRPPSAAEIARMEAEAAALADVTQRIQTFRTNIAHYRPILIRHLSGIAAEHPQRGVRTQIVEAMTDIEAWMAKHTLKLETLLREDVGMQADFPGAATGTDRH
ncbi:hypothetical protein B0H14DRAFT_2561344 [Mycena olivaceomarginata]|nr:hypothetical protein B0H14DRAFT_2561344 [Mycena olivaceomarginata]